MLCTSAAIAFFTAASLLTGGNTINWLKDNFSGVSADKFWYFFWYNGRNKIFSLSDLFSTPLLYFYIASLLVIFLYVLNKNYNAKYLLLLYIASTIIMASMLSSIGGTASMRYYLATILTVFFVIPLAVSLLFPVWITKLNIATRNLCFPLLSTLLIIYISVLITNIIPVYLLVTDISTNKVFWVQEFNGWLPNKWKHNIQVVRKINQELKNELPTKRILSTYSSGIDVVAKAFNPTGVDYIIHALGTPARSHYIESLLSFKPKYITTLREDYTQ